MTTSNRQIKTGHDAQQAGMTLEACEDLRGKFTGRLSIMRGERITMSRSEARRIMAVSPKLFRIVVD